MRNKLFGIIGYPLEHSFSKAFFEQKFSEEGIENVLYKNFSIEKIDLLPAWLNKENNLCGFNVTIPYKEAVMPFLDSLSDIAKEVGAVNVVKIDRTKHGKLFLTGYNTDVYGFEKSLLEKTQCNSVFSQWFSVKQKDKITQRCTEQTQRITEKNVNSKQLSALILGTGGAAKAVGYVLGKLNIDYQCVSRTFSKNTLSYEQLDRHIIANNLLLINATPLGMFPDTTTYPPIDYTAIGKEHLLFDLVYNPAETLFLKKGKEQGANTQNGYEMLVYQAEEAWKIWNED